MTRYVALLRGINVGGGRKVPMRDLREVFESRGFTDVNTYIQSGNVVFRAKGRVSPVDLRSAIADRFGFDVDVMLRTSTDLRRIVAANPYSGTDPKLLHVGFFGKAPDRANVQRLELAPFAPETAEVRRTEIYFCLPNGMGRSKLPAYVGRRLDVPTTIRNWKTTLTLLELVQTV